MLDERRPESVRKDEKTSEKMKKRQKRRKTSLPPFVCVSSVTLVVTFDTFIYNVEHSDDL